MLKQSRDFHIEKLGGKHKEKILDFDCGHPDINDFVRKDIFEYQKQKLGVSYVLADSEGMILSFITLAMGSVKLPPPFVFRVPEISEVPNQLPALKIGRLGTQKTEQKKGYAKELIEYATFLAIEFGDKIGCYYLTLDAYQENIEIYKKRGFIPFFSELKGRETMPMFMEIYPRQQQTS